MSQREMMVGSGCAAFIETAVAGPAQNAWRHGMYARKLLLDGEEGAAFESLREGLVGEWRPRNVTEWMLVDQLAKQQWRLMRAGDAEVEKMRTMAARPFGVYSAGAVPDRAVAALAHDFGAADSSFHRTQAYQQRLEKSVLRLINQLLALKKQRRKIGKLRAAGVTQKSAQSSAGPGDAPICENVNGRNEIRAADR